MSASIRYVLLCR